MLTGFGASVLLALTLIAYFPALGGGYVWDDDRLVTDNPNLLTSSRLVRTWADPRANSDYYPLTHTSWWLEYRFWRLNPFVFHLDNVLLHAGNAIVFWAILRSLALPGAWAAAALFALHPVHVESVAWIAERKNVLSGFFCLLAVWSYLRFALAGPDLPPGRRRLFRGLSLFFFLCALLAKPMTMAAAAVLPLLLWWKRRRLVRSDLLSVVPYFVVAAPLAALTIWLQYTHVNARGEMFDHSLLQRVLLSGRVLWFYAGKLAWPRNLTFAYPKWDIDPGIWWQYCFVGSAAAVLVALVLLRRRLGPGPAAAVLAFAALLSPALGFVNIYWHRYYFVADHIPYLASTSLIALATATSVKAAARFGRRGAAVLRGAGAAVLVLFGVLTWGQCGIYRDSETIWRDTLGKDPDSFMAHTFLGNIAYERGRAEEALGHYREALRINRGFPGFHNNLGLALAALGRTEEAAVHFREALRRNPADHQARINLEELFDRQLQEEGAIDRWQNLLALAPGDAEVNHNLGYALAARGRTEEAINRYREALRIRPDYAEAHHNLGLALGTLGRADEAIAHFREAVRLDPDDAKARNDLGQALGALGRTDEAIVHFREALRINPSFPEACFNLGLAYAGRGRLEEAVRLVEKACRLTGDKEPHSLAALASLYAEAGRFAEAASTARRAADLAGALGQRELAVQLAEKARRYGGGRDGQKPP